MLGLLAWIMLPPCLETLEEKKCINSISRKFKDQKVCAVGGLVPAREWELDLAVVHLGDQGTSALAGGHHLAPNDLGQQVNISS